MLKFFLVGWVCLGTPNVDYQCVRMGSEVIFPDYQTCNEYFQLVKEDLADTGAELKFTCVQAGLLEDVLWKRITKNTTNGLSIRFAMIMTNVFA